VKRRGPWSPDQTRSFLGEARAPLRLACNGASGAPLLASLWFVAEGDRLWCATPRSARVVELLSDDPRCAFEVARDAPPYRGVRGQGRATLHDDRGPEVLERLIDRYLDDPDGDFARWLRGRDVPETAIAIDADRILTWDFAERMGDAATAGEARS
jgi:nitroimidazol reductase NimA-like FMN-containing flavoprotein (pyridoxamine 5'-phosphate oxidase superfamily)